MMYIILYNFFVSMTMLTFLCLYTLRHIKIHWSNKNIHIPLLTITTKFIFVIFFYNLSKNGSFHDASSFYFKPIDFYPLLLGDHTMYNIGYFLRVYGKLSYFNSTLLLSFLAFFGLFFLLRCASKHYSKNYKLNNYYLILFLFPSLHFWSIGFAKETFVFFGVCLLSYKIYEQKKISLFETALITLPILLIRPHYLFFFVLTIMIYTFFKSKN